MNEKKKFIFAARSMKGEIFFIPTKAACEKSRKQLNILEIFAVTIQFN